MSTFLTTLWGFNDARLLALLPVSIQKYKNRNTEDILLYNKNTCNHILSWSWYLALLFHVCMMHTVMYWTHPQELTVAFSYLIMLHYIHTGTDYVLWFKVFLVISTIF